MVKKECENETTGCQYVMNRLEGTQYISALFGISN